MGEFLGSVVEFINNTNLPAQISGVDAKALFTNPWFLVPFIAFVCYNLYKQAMDTLALTGLAIGLWLFTGSRYMEGLIVDGVVQIGKILPVAGVFIGAIAVAVYLLFMRGD
ncbi:MAG: hypothetical protein ACOY3Z_01335 [Thermodesulfobacteriota bacterium]